MKSRYISFSVQIMQHILTMPHRLESDSCEWACIMMREFEPGQPMMIIFFPKHYCEKILTKQY